MNNVFDNSYKITFAPNALGHTAEIFPVKLVQGHHSQFVR